ncbi:MAG: hypothetical protein AAFV07_10770 [Bacteroidota bacterium]
MRSVVCLLLLLQIWGLSAQQVISTDIQIANPVGGNVSFGGEPMVASRNVVIPEGVEAVFEPGAILGLYPEVSIQVAGTLRIKGTAEDPVIFTLAGRGQIEGKWKGIQILPGGILIAEHFNTYYAETLLQGDLSQVQMDQAVLAFHQTAVKWEGRERGTARIQRSLWGYNERALDIRAQLPEKLLVENLFCANVRPVVGTRLALNARLNWQCWCESDQEKVIAAGVLPRSLLPLGGDCPDSDHPLIRGGGTVTIVIDDDVSMVPIDEKALAGFSIGSNMIQDFMELENAGPPVQFRLLNMAGQEMLSGAMAAASGRRVLVSHLPRAMYMLQIQRGNAIDFKRVLLIP